MPNPTMDEQVRLALRDDQKAEKFAADIAELAAQMVNTTFKFAEDIKSTYESEAFPKRRRDDRNFDETDHAKLALGAFSFFMYVLDKDLRRMDINIVRDAVFDLILGNVVERIYARSFTDPLAQTDNFVLNHFGRRLSLLAEAPTILGEGPEDKNAAIWRASQAICEEDLGRDDRRLPLLVQAHLMKGLEGLAFADNIAAMVEELCPPGLLRKTA
jgi:hypothetical protein